MKITDINVITGEVIERDATPKEIEQQKADQAFFEAEKQAKEEKKAKRLQALLKLEALGLTEDDLKALGL